MSIKPEILDHCVANNLNVLLKGHSGIGKTSVVKECFNRHKLKWKYFSASTMDPWVDFIGIPQKVTDKSGNVYLEFVRPKDFQNDEVEAIFFDEFNRSHPKVRNAVMELIQFRSINGRVFKNLRMIWAAVNPDDPEDGFSYDVEKIDTAQLDRFEVHIDMPYKPDKDYFVAKYGKSQGLAAIEWWHRLSNEVKQKLSPRRLDTALRMITINGDIRFVIPPQANASELLLAFSNGPIKDTLADLFSKRNEDATSKFIANSNNWNAASSYVLKNDSYMAYFLPFLSNEDLAALIAANPKVLDFVVKNRKDISKFVTVIDEILTAKSNHKLCKAISRLLPNNYLPGGKTAAIPIPLPPSFAQDPFYCNKHKKSANYDAEITSASKEMRLRNNTNDRIRIFNEIRRCIPHDMTPNQATETLQVLSNLVIRSHLSTLKILQDFFGILNFCISVTIKQNTGMSFSSIRKNYGTMIKKLERDSSLYQRIYKG